MIILMNLTWGAWLTIASARKNELVLQHRAGSVLVTSKSQKIE